MLQLQYWESPLLDLAHQALESEPFTQSHLVHEQKLLSSAYQYCETITRQNSKTFFMASSLLPKAKRRAAQALYAFCRISDDIVDRSTGNIQEQLQSWRQHVVHNSSLPDVQSIEQAVNLAWSDTRRAYRIPLGYVEQLIDGLSLDFIQTRYQNFSELAKYCYGVACTVGLMSMHIVGYAGHEAIPYAIRLGVALQITNILRDVGEDWRAGRLYLPQDELDAFGLSEEDIDTGKVDNRWREFMRFQIQRARRLYADAMPGVGLLHRDGRFAIAAAGDLYSAILDQIERNDYDVFSRRASVSKWGKIRRLPGIWHRSFTASSS